GGHEQNPDQKERRVPRIATSVAHASLPRGIAGMNVSWMTCDQSGRMTIAVMTYEKRKSASHFRTLAIFPYGSRIVAALIATPKNTTNRWELTPVSISVASAIPERSAPM